MILVDTCILLDIVQADGKWADWSLTQLEHAADRGDLLINPIIYAEFSVWYEDLVDLEHALAGFGVVFREVPREALFLAGKAFRQYRARGGIRASVLPDFFIGAHAAVSELLVLTRDPTRIRSYFPGVALCVPEPGSATS